MSVPKVSFILPAYKRRFLHEAIASILAQTYRDFELVVVDDCSPENLKEVVDSFQDERLSYHCNEKNLGREDLVASWNHAISYATGEWLVLASDDDVYDSRYLEELLKLAARYPLVDVLHCRIAAINENGDWKWIGAPRAEYETGVEMLYHCGVLRLEQRIGDLMIRHSSILSNGGYPWMPKAWYSDHEAAILFAKDGGAVCAHDVLFYWRVSDENISFRFDDAEEKLRAHELHRKWMWDFIGKCMPESESDKAILEFAKRGIDRSIDGLTVWVLGRLPLKAWWRVIHSQNIPKRIRGQQLRSRMRSAVTRYFRIL